MEIWAVIPARGGSKTIPRKNIRLLLDKPLIRYTIDKALQCKYITAVLVTSEDAEILQYARQIDGVESIERPAELAGDDITMDPVLQRAAHRRYTPRLRLFRLYWDKKVQH